MGQGELDSVLKVIRRYKYLESPLEDEMKKVLTYTKEFKPEERLKLADVIGVFLAQAAVVWFDDEFIKDSTKFDAVKALSGEQKFYEAESEERKHLNSLCYEYGGNLASRFFLPTSPDVLSDPAAKKAMRQMAKETLWSRLPNLHRYADQMLSIGSSTLSLKATCFNNIQLGISNREIKEKKDRKKRPRRT